MTNIQKCSICGNTLISEEFIGHVCKAPYKPIKFIHVNYTSFFTTRNPDGSQSAVAEDKDGTIYLIDPTNRNFTVNKTTADYTAPVEIIFLFYEVV